MSVFIRRQLEKRFAPKPFEKIPMLERGLIQVYTGSSERFNYAPIGLSLRAAGQNLRTLITAFAPHEGMGELPAAAEILKPNLVIDYRSVFEAIAGKAGEGPSREALGAFRRCAEAVRSGKFDMVIFDGVHSLLKEGRLALDDLLTLMETKPRHVEMVLTGPGAPQAVLDRADLVTAMAERGPVSQPDEGPRLKAKGYVEVVTGNGKGKTTYCLGKAVLESCAGIRGLILQFIKSPHPYGEVKAIQKFPSVEIKSMGEGFLDPDSPGYDRRHLDAARKAWEKCLREIFSLKYGLVVLDEINTAASYGLVNPERIQEMCSLKPMNLQLLLSGRNAHPHVMEAATSVIEMEEVKHPYQKGIRARKGIEF
jgi:cob(I)alamin adenosyltransferase